MKRNCNLELRLLPPSAALHFPESHDNRHEEEREEQQPLTIFYNGRISVCNVTELQAREIIMLASQEMEEKLKTLLGSSESPLLQSPPVCSSSPTTGLSMKRSLQRFLQKRRNRIQSTSPY